MSKPSPSPLEQIHNAIKSQNIFKGIGVFRSDNVWGQGHPDVVSFNAHASDTVFQALDHVRQDHNQKVTSLVFTATPGQGKTHLINRIRRQLINENDTIFVYVNVLNFTDLDQINFYFQQTIVDSLSRSNSQEITQWQALASTIVNSVIPNTRQPQVLINQFDKVYQDGLQKGSNLIDLLIQKLNIPNYINPYIVRAVLWMLSPKVSSYAERWLAGEILEASHAQYLGVPPSIHGNQDQDSSALNVVKQILNLIDRYSSIIICFDELDTAENSNDEGLRTEQVVAVLVKSLYDTLEQYNLSKGVIILMVMMQDTYINLFTSMQYGGVHERICAFTQNKPIELEFIVEPNSMIELVTLYLSHFYQKRQLVPPEPIYPFTADQLKKYVKVNRPTMREALKWCAENFKVDETDLLPESPDERIELALSRENDINLSETLEDSQFIGHVLRFGFTALIGQSLSGETPTGDQLNNVVVQEIVDIAPKAKNNDWINFKILGTEEDQPFKLGVMVLQHTHGLSVGAGMHRIVDYKTFDLTRGCLVRSKSRKIKSHWDSYKLLRKLVKQQGGEWVDLELENIELLIKLYIVNEQKDIYNLTDDQILSYTQEKMLTNPLLLEILSPPSGNIPDVTVIDPSNIDELLDEFFRQYKGNSDDVEQASINAFDNVSDTVETIENSESSSEPSTAESVNPSTKPVEPASQSDLSATTSEDQTSEESATPETVNPPAETWLTRDYRGMNIASFSLNGTEYEVTTWRELLIMTCTLMKLHHNKDFAKVLEIRGRKNSYFSKNAEDLKNPEKISGSGLYVETNLSANQIVKFVHRIITIFGYTEESLDIKTHE
ncbi:P-loop NTPase fold protein [Spirulina sp. CCNP1310]|uniref:P-loop NTPase fold protein n=1 Tax=Spirulina sp. CCNP1310 TaxID=3110249 RepID=UPI002B1EDAF0|nr:P-loop NTPase fold protein [Spirulina sp. CCNP1310]MEA5418276.1 P-loop NTPase fold protein [Spirulina sp. CCNP1310]